MDEIFNIKFPIELYTKENVILKFSNKQGGDYNIFSYYWQCFVWAATIGFLRNEKKALSSPTERIFTLNTMRGNGGEKDVQALLCMCIARYGSLDIMKEPEDAIRLISEYANGGFYHILKLMENGENSFNDLEKVKQEIFTRAYNAETSSEPIIIENEYEQEDDTFNEESNEEETTESTHNYKKVRSRWTTSETNELKSLFSQGMTLEQLSGFLYRSEDNIKQQLIKMGLM